MKLCYVLFFSLSLTLVVFTKAGVIEDLKLRLNVE